MLRRRRAIRQERRDDIGRREEASTSRFVDAAGRAEWREVAGEREMLIEMIPSVGPIVVLKCLNKS